MKIKRFLLSVLFISLFLTMSIAVQAEPYRDSKCGANATWRIDSSDTLIISGSGAVTSAPWQTYDRLNFDKVLISEGITSLPDQGFYYCLGLQKVSIPVSLTSVGTGCFSECAYLQSVSYNGTFAQWRKISFVDVSSPLFYAELTCKDGIYNICGPDAFWNLSDDGVLTITGSGPMSDFSPSMPAPWHSLYRSIKTVNIGAGITTIGQYAFYNLDPVIPFAMTSITLPKSLISVGFMAFSDCIELYNVYYDDTYEHWGQLDVAPQNEMLLGATLHCSDKTIRMCGQSAFWDLDSQGTLTIFGQGPTADFSGYTVAPWSDQRDKIKKLVVCEGITHLGRRALDDCYLEEATLADSVISIGNYAFENSRLERITIGSKLMILGEGAFDECDRLTAISLPNTVTTIGKYAFRNCDDLEKATLGTGLTTLGKEAFYGCTSLKEIILADGITAIDECTFVNCKALTKVTLPKNLKTVGDGAFIDCTSLTEIILPKSVTKIGYQSFENCASLSEIILPESVVEVDGRAFQNCTALTKIYIPAKVENFAPSVMEGCVRLTAFQVDKKNPNYTSDSSGVLFNKDKTVLLRAPQALAGSYKIPGSVTELADEAFRGCAKITEVTVPDSVTELSNELFLSCDNLKTVTLSGNLTFIGCSAFQGCDALTHIVLPGSLTEIDRKAFYGCDNLKSINLHDGITYIGDGAFAGCAALETFYWPKGIPTIKQDTFNGCFSLTEVEIPNTVTAVEDRAFYQCINLTRFTLPASVTEFDSGILAFCNKLTDLRVDPANPNYMTDSRGVLFTKDQTTLIYAPGGLSGAYEIPDGTITVACLSISRCHKLTQLTIPASVSRIEFAAIYENENLEVIRVAEGNPNYASDSAGVLFNKGKTLLITAPDKLSIQYWVPNTVTRIEEEALRFTGITSICIPVSVTEIGWAAFAETPIEQVYYAGTRNQWKNIEVEEGNDGLTYASVYYENTTGYLPNQNVTQDETIGAPTVPVGTQKPTYNSTQMATEPTPPASRPIKPGTKPTAPMVAPGYPSTNNTITTPTTVQPTEEATSPQISPEMPTAPEIIPQEPTTVGAAAPETEMETQQTQMIEPTVPTNEAEEDNTSNGTIWWIVVIAAVGITAGAVILINKKKK